MVKWKCTVCNYIYDEEKEGKGFKDLASGGVCPVCGGTHAIIGPKTAMNNLLFDRT